jgi:hypothetical protein
LRHVGHFNGDVIDAGHVESPWAGGGLCRTLSV